VLFEGPRRLRAILHISVIGGSLPQHYGAGDGLYRTNCPLSSLGEQL
jgi:hypothetical protein